MVDGLAPTWSYRFTWVEDSLERSSDLSNSGEFKRQTAWDNAVYIHSFLRYYSYTQSILSWFYKETEIKI